MTNSIRNNEDNKPDGLEPDARMIRWRKELSNLPKPTPEQQTEYDARVAAFHAEDQRRRFNELVRGFVDEVGPRLGAARLHKLRSFGNTAAKEKQEQVYGRVRDLANDMERHVHSGRENVIFYGPKGSGKTHLACALLGIAMVRHRFPAAFISAVDLIADARAMGADGNRKVKECQKKRILLIDDLIPSGGLTPFGGEVLFRVIDARYRNLLPTWVTANVATREEMETAIGPAITDRLLAGAAKFFMNWPSVREEASQPDSNGK